MNLKGLVSKASAAAGNVAGKVAGSAKKAGGTVKKAAPKKADIAAAVRGAAKRPENYTGKKGFSSMSALEKGGVAAAGVGAAGVGVNAMAPKGGSSSPKPAASSSSSAKPAAAKPAASAKPAAPAKPGAAPAKPGATPKATGPSGVNTTTADGIAKASGTKIYRARKGDSLWSIAEKTKPEGTTTAAYWTQLKKLNSTNGKVNRLYRNSGVKLPNGAITSGDSGYKIKSKNTASDAKAR
jgi:hypothetical protein